MGSCCIIDKDKVIKSFDPMVFYSVLFAGVVIGMVLLFKVKPWWNIFINLIILTCLYETNNLDILSIKIKSRLSAVLYKIAPPLGGFIYKHVNKVLVLILLFSNIAMVLYLIMLLSRKKIVSRGMSMDIHVHPDAPGYNSAAVLFSGGTDSTNAALYAASEYGTVHLITYDRLGFYNIGASTVRANKLSMIFKDKNFIHKIINIDKFYKKICYRNYIRDVFRHRLMLLLNCGLCKLAMHWQMILYCIDNKINAVYDGSNIEMLDPSQNKNIVTEMENMYKKFGIKLYYPVYYKSKEIREKKLYDLKISEKKEIKWTKDTWKIQPFCTQEKLFVTYHKYRIYGFYMQKAELLHQKYEKEMLVFHREKRAFVISKIDEYLNKKSPHYSSSYYGH